MRTHVWRKQFSRLSQRGQRLPFQRPRAFHSVARQLDAHPSPNPNVETANQESAPTETPIRPPSSSRRAGRFAARRLKEVTPFTIPDWFLHHNVRLHAPSPDEKASQEARCWTLVDRDTGHTVLTLPFTNDSDHRDNHFFIPSAHPKDVDTASVEKEKELENTLVSPKHDVPHESLSPVKDKDADLTPATAKDKDAVQDEITRAINHLSPNTLQTPDPRLLLSLQLQLLLHAAFDRAGPQAARYTKCHLDLNTKDFFAHKELDTYVHQIADLVQADLIQLDANDFAELSQDYVEPNDPAPGSISSLAYDTFRGVSAARKREIHVDIIDGAQNDEANEDEESEHASDFISFDGPTLPNPASGIMDWIKKNPKLLHDALNARKNGMGAGIIALGDMGGNNNDHGDHSSSADSHSRAASLSDWEELKLSTLLDTLLDSVRIKKETPVQDVSTNFLYEPISTSRDATAPPPPTKDGLERFLADFLSKRIDSGRQAHNMQGTFESVPSSFKSEQPSQRTIVHVRDMDHIRNSPQGETVINKLVRVVQRRRKDGEQIVIVGTTASSRQAPSHPGEEDDELYFQYMKYPLATAGPQNVGHQLLMAPHVQQNQERSVAVPGYHRLFDINMRHIQSMVRRLGLPVSENFFSAQTRTHLNISGTFMLGEETLPQDEVQRIVLCADSLRSLYTTSPALETFHIALAAMLINTVDSALTPVTNDLSFDSIIPTALKRGESEDKSSSTKDSAAPKLDMEKLKKSCSKHETRLLSGVVDPASLRTTFNDVHADPNTIESLKTLTSLTLLRPEAFSYGVLAADRLPGLLLYGPPGTGKTLLAKAVAKESSATVLEVSGAQIYEKYVGEGEKMVNAVFSLAKKLSPCVVFIDEADALFGSRGGANNRTTHREIINQFLRGWDGMDDHSVFMMVATNRPFDLDDAVLRRLPRRLLVDLPLAKDREGILGIHLKGENLDPAVSLSDLAKNTPLYSGSDLKNLCVAAALAAVRDENNALEAARAKGDTDFKLPERRTLAPSHFEKAMQEISASVSEDMATLGAIRKFDEQYGEKRARTKKAGYGFGLGSSNAIDETGARVRPDESSR
ncbi:AAA-domain-containing protein [Aureobasidium pullulans]|nr:AAA-domain-containing protein [Aureobasidium pullulans]